MIKAEIAAAKHQDLVNHKQINILVTPILPVLGIVKGGSSLIYL